MLTLGFIAEKRRAQDAALNPADGANLGCGARWVMLGLSGCCAGELGPGLGLLVPAVLVMAYRPMERVEYTFARTLRSTSFYNPAQSSHDCPAIAGVCLRC